MASPSNPVRETIRSVASMRAEQHSLVKEYRATVDTVDRFMPNDRRLEIGATLAAILAKYEAIGVEIKRAQEQLKMLRQKRIKKA